MSVLKKIKKLESTTSNLNSISCQDLIDYFSISYFYRIMFKIRFLSIWSFILKKERDIE